MADFDAQRRNNRLAEGESGLIDGLGAVPPEPTFTEKDMDRGTLLRKMNEAMDDALVEAAASMMRSKLSKARDKGRGGWWNPKECTAKGLREAMEQHTEKGDPVDVMNLAAMVAVREMLESPNAGDKPPQAGLD